MQENATTIEGSSSSSHTGQTKTSRHRSATLLRLLAPVSTTTGKVQIVGLGLLGIMLFAAVFAPLLTAYDPKASVCEPFSGPTFAHILGCNDFGQDLFSQLLYGARVSLFVGILVASCSTIIATFLALSAGYHAGRENEGTSALSSIWIDKTIMRMVDVALSLPFLPLVIVLGVYFGASVSTQILVITLVMWAQPVREMRAQILSIRAATFVEAARAMGASSSFISLKHILPELAPLIVPQFVRIAHNAILVEAALSFLGLGDPLQNSWGSILFHANARTAFLTGAWTYWIVPPGLAIAVTVVAFAFIGYGFDASLSPRNAAKGQLPAKAKGSPSQDGQTALSIKNLSVSYPLEQETLDAVKGASLSVKKGQLLGLVGESGSGKSTLALSILRLLRQPADIHTGEIVFNSSDLLQLTDSQMRRIRANQIALIPQSAMNALNPVLTIGDQLSERFTTNMQHPKQAVNTLATRWMERVGLTPAHLKSYPHELSGGMRQRAVIAIALCNNAELVIADEPTTGLDVLVQESIMQLLLQLRHDMGLTILFVTHNLPLIARHCDHLAVMHQGKIVETNTPKNLMAAPKHLHSKALFDSLPGLDDERRWAKARTQEQSKTRQPVLTLKRVSKSFLANHHQRMPFGTRDSRTYAVKDVSFSLKSGDTLGLVGGSGAGKSTIARMIMGITMPDKGHVLLNGKNWQDLSHTEALAMRSKVHMVFQDPYQSLNNRLSIAELVAESLLIHQGGHCLDYKRKISEALELVRLPADDTFLSRLPTSLSGGQRQRVAFARAIVTNPSLIIADEPTSMLDQSIRMNVMDVMDTLRAELGTAFLFITHDIALARHFCDRMIVLNSGHLIEENRSADLVRNPQHAYTKALIAAV
ncbi:ATP-binding cassette domain-containing protein [Cohaesibacter celericrescens]|uniref:ABC transporter n=1 Tax=Cohaesibacter celericrescens TaxID=2067669 RepID=A0A2N5XQ30_9HYPH|nr:ATP-binding cassette domain-containing protein [Cohaesibacter celericrescens]PLW76622.1 hypothetical protein C0081_13815 [Cohaesibacter celericrescens]